MSAKHGVLVRFLYGFELLVFSEQVQGLSGLGQRISLATHSRPLHTNQRPDHRVEMISENLGHGAGI